MTHIICWEPGATDDEKAKGLKALEEYMEYRKARAKKRLSRQLHQTDSQVGAGENAPESEDTPLKDNTQNE